MTGIPSGHQEHVRTPPASSRQPGSLQTARAARSLEPEQRPLGHPLALSVALPAKETAPPHHDWKAAGAEYRPTTRRTRPARPRSGPIGPRSQERSSMPHRTCRPSPPRPEPPHPGPPPRRRPLGRGQLHPHRHPLGRGRPTDPSASTAISHQARAPAGPRRPTWNRRVPTHHRAGARLGDAGESAPSRPPQARPNRLRKPGPPPPRQGQRQQWRRRALGGGRGRRRSGSPKQSDAGAKKLSGTAYKDSYSSVSVRAFHVILTAT
jgi:hypothetical protein